MNSQFVLKVFVAAFATVGVEEFLKNFIKTEKTFIYAVLMIPLAVGCYFAIEALPVWVIGSLLTIGCVQICYQTIVQGFKTAIKGLSHKFEGKPQEEK
ncbi:MAG: hypothetical protein II563_09170 [Treponema sp.]|nr:hypothetical protein [Treponema sp.]